jgi:hypothetical protein
MGNFGMPNFRIPSFSERYSEAVVEAVRRLEASLKPDQELQIHCRTASGVMRVFRLQITDESVLIVHGRDEQERPTFHISTSWALELTCTFVPKDEKTERKPIGFEYLKSGND